MSADPIIEKIKKLLRMKRGGTPDEIATALRLAQELAEKHGINLEGINPDDDNTRPDRPISHTDQILGARIQWECKYAALICDVYFHVSALIRWEGRRVPRKYRQWMAPHPGSGYRITFVGTAWDTEIALYVYHFLVGHFRREWTTKRGRCRNRRTFIYGMYIGLSSKLRDRQPPQSNQPGLVAVDRQLQRRQDYLAKHFGEITQSDVKPDLDASSALEAGWRAGQATEIRPAVKTVPQTHQLT